MLVENSIKAKSLKFMKLYQALKRHFFGLSPQEFPLTRSCQACDNQLLVAYVYKKKISFLYLAVEDAFLNKILKNLIILSLS